MLRRSRLLARPAVVELRTRARATRQQQLQRGERLKLALLVLRATTPKRKRHELLDLLAKAAKDPARLMQLSASGWLLHHSRGRRATPIQNTCILPLQSNVV